MRFFSFVLFILFGAHFFCGSFFQCTFAWENEPDEEKREKKMLLKNETEQNKNSSGAMAFLLAVCVYLVHVVGEGHEIHTYI